MNVTRLTRAIISLGTVAALTSACGSAGSVGSGPNTASSSASAPAVEVDEGLLTVDIKIRRSLLDPEGKQTDAEVIQAAKDKGMSATVDGDTVIYTMTRSQQRELLDQLKTSLSETNQNMVDDQANSFTAIDVNDEMNAVKVKVDRDKYTEFEALYALAFYVQGGLFQQFSGVDSDKVDVKVEFVDDATGEVLNSGTLQEWMARQSG